MEQALYREYRPKKFKEVIGQPQVVETLEKMLDKNEITHSYLFSGSRGTGKTSVARIFAKELGCADIDIFEIDAASHTSVENIRDLNESVNTLPVDSDYKIYILDEAHMLSKSAFNAFLKTLEEPPEYAIFILATTEVEKIPDTVVSRCTQFPFNKPNILTISKLLTSVAKKKGVALDTQSANLISIVAEGSFRDALGALQKVLLMSKGKKVSVDDVEAVLGAPKHKMVNDYLFALVEKDVEKGMDVLIELEKTNTDMELFGKLAIRKLRAAILLQSEIDYLLDEYDGEDQKEIKKLSKLEGVNHRLLESLLSISTKISRSYVKQIAFEELLLSNATDSR